jgi:peptidoglycan/xylan/chitin deacetylase (PgdA/CDA1 family)
MRILQLLSQTQPTGAETYALALSDWLTDQGHAVHLISDRLHAPTKQPYTPLAVHGNRWKTRWQSTRFLRRFLRENKIQVIHCHSRAAARLAYWSTWGSKVAVVSTLHGRQPISLSKKLHDIYGEKCISICENLTAQVTVTLGMNPRKIKLIRNPIATGALPFVEVLAPGPAGSSSVPPQRIAWIGRFTGPKGTRAQQFVAQVVPRLLETFPHLQIELIGGRPSLLGEETLQKITQLQERFPSRLSVENYRPDLDQELSNYQLVFAAGRIAMTSLIRGIPTLAIGEYKSEGLVTSDTLEPAMASNFGDIGPEGSPMAEVDFQQLLAATIKVLREPLAVQERQILRQKVLAQYDLPKVCQKILNTYKSAYFLKHHNAYIPVLMYHKIPDRELKTRHRIFVTKDRFERHLQYFQKKGFTTLHFADLEAYRSGERDFATFPRKPLVLTFDDGYLDNLKNAAPLLQKYRTKAVIYLLADHSLQENEWDLGHDDGEPSHQMMSLSEKQQLPKYGFEIGSHGFRHQKITEMNEGQARQELELSKKQLEADFKAPIYSYAFTYGITSPHAAELAEEAGYSFALNTDTGGLHIEENPYAIFRSNIFPEDGPAQLRKKTAPWYRRYFHFKRGR